MKKELFEEQLRSAYEQHEGSVHPSTWSKIERGLSRQGGGFTFGKTGWILGSALIVGVLSIFFWWNVRSTDNSNASNSKNQEAVSEESNHSSQIDTELAENQNASNPITNLNAEDTGQTSMLSEQSFSNGNNVAATSSQLRNSNPSNTRKNGFEISQNTTALGGQKSQDGSSTVVNSVTNSLSNIRQTCAGTEVSFKPQSGPSDGSYLWNFGDGAFSSESNPKHRFLKPGTYEVSLSVTDNKNAQINTVNMSETITILPNPTADFDWSFINGSKEAPTVEIKNLSSNAVNAQWNFADGTQSNDEHPIKSFTNKGSHSVMITAINEYGCKDQRIKYININSDYNLNAPGYVHCGEGFMPEGLLSAKGKITLTIYDGAKKIFETKSNKTPWYCSDASGNKVEPNKQYPWIAIIHDTKTGEDRYYSGAVLVKP